MKQYKKKPIVVEATQLNQYGDFVRAVEWVRINGGKAHYFPSEYPGTNDHLTVVTIDGNLADVHVGDYLVRDIKGGFYPCRRDIFEETHDCLSVEPLFLEPPVATYIPASRQDVPLPPPPPPRTGLGT